jgi:hypothetical protein
LGLGGKVVKSAPCGGEDIGDDVVNIRSALRNSAIDVGEDVLIVRFVSDLEPESIVIESVCNMEK